MASEGGRIGKYAAENEVKLVKNRHFDDSAHHLGDDTGAALSSAYRNGGVHAAVQVLEEYLEAYNRVRRANAAPELSREAAVKNLPWAFGPNKLTDQEQEDIRSTFLR